MRGTGSGGRCRNGTRAGAAAGTEPEGGCGRNGTKKIEGVCCDI